MDETCQQAIIKDKAGRFVKGHSGNPAGINGYTKLYSILQQIKYTGKIRGTGFEKHIADRFYINDAVLMAVLKKAVPDTLEHTGEIKGAQTKVVVMVEMKDANQSEAGRLPTSVFVEPS